MAQACAAAPLTSLAESGLSAILVYFTLTQLFGVGPLHAAVAAAIGLATSPPW